MTVEFRFEKTTGQLTMTVDGKELVKMFLTEDEARDAVKVLKGYLEELKRRPVVIPGQLRLVE